MEVNNIRPAHFRLLRSIKIPVAIDNPITMKATIMCKITRIVVVIVISVDTVSKILPTLSNACKIVGIEIVQAKVIITPRIFSNIGIFLTS